MANDAFDQLVAAMDTAMVVVTTASPDGEVDGCLVGFHAQCSIDPPRGAVWLSKANRTHELAERATHLAVHLLGPGDHDVAEHFGGLSGDDVDKLADWDWEPGPGGVPLLARCPSRFVGQILERAAGIGDHDLYVVDVVEADVAAGPVVPLRLSAVTDIEPGLGAEERR
jgi:flavin reductase (DIM6/NTAB) family NADH-FMN oxidoreductase RutF